MATMRAVVLQRFGDVDGLMLVEIPKPAVQPGKVLVRVCATSVNPADCKIRRNGPAHAPSLPAVLGLDISGHIAEVGDCVSSWREGDAVYGCAAGVKGVDGGALAEYVLVDPTLIAHAPRRLALCDAAALPLVSITAWEGLVERAARSERNALSHQSVLVHGATGGVGHIAVQLARCFGAQVSATVSTAHKKALALKLGAHQVIDYTQEDVSSYAERITAGKGFDLVFDAVGGDNLEPSLQAARHYGCVVSISTRQSYDLTLMHAKSLTLHVIFMLIRMTQGIERWRHGAILQQIAHLVDEGAVTPLIDPRTFTLEDTRSAHSLVESHAQVGKVLIRVSA